MLVRHKERKMKIDSNLRKIRLEFGLTIRQLAKKINVTCAVLRGIEILKLPCDARMQKDIAGLFGLTRNKIFDEDGYAIKYDGGDI